MAEETTLYNSIPADSQKLESSQDWPDWIRTLEYHATNRGIWNLIDPAAPDAANPHIKPSIPTIHELVSERQEMATTIYNLSTALWEKTPEALRDAANKPNLRTVTAEEVRDEHDRLVATAAARVTATIETTRAYQHIQNWVRALPERTPRAQPNLASFPGAPRIPSGHGTGQKRQRVKGAVDEGLGGGLSQGRRSQCHGD